MYEVLTHLILTQLWKVGTVTILLSTWAHKGQLCSMAKITH